MFNAVSSFAPHPPKFSGKCQQFAGTSLAAPIDSVHFSSTSTDSAAFAANIRKNFLKLKVDSPIILSNINGYSVDNIPSSRPETSFEKVVVTRQIKALTANTGPFTVGDESHDQDRLMVELYPLKNDKEPKYSFYIIPYDTKVTIKLKDAWGGGKLLPNYSIAPILQPIFKQAGLDTRE